MLRNGLFQFSPQETWNLKLKSQVDQEQEKKWPRNRGTQNPIQGLMVQVAAYCLAIISKASVLGIRTYDKYGTPSADIRLELSHVSKVGR